MRKGFKMSALKPVRIADLRSSKMSAPRGLLAFLLLYYAFSRVSPSVFFRDMKFNDKLINGVTLFGMK